MKKIYYSIREVADETGIEPQVLRYWEKEFPMLRPRRGRSGNRLYRERDLRIVLAIKRLRQDEKYTLKGARERLREDPSLWRDSAVDKAAAAPGPPKELEEIVNELREMLGQLKSLVEGGR